MKKTLLLLTAGCVAAGLSLYAQNAGRPNVQAQGLGRGGAPYAWNDKNGDGICDFTGLPVGQGRGAAVSPGWRGQWAPGMGRGMGRGMGFGVGRGMGPGAGRGWRPGLGRGAYCPWRQAPPAGTTAPQVPAK